METLSQLLRRTIKEGAPMYNRGDKKGCFDVYLDAAKYACQQEGIKASVIGLLEQAVDEAVKLGDQDGAWVLRRAFDEILSPANFFRSRCNIVKKQQTDKRPTAQRQQRQQVPSVDGDHSSTITNSSYWPDENTADMEKAQALSDIAFILRASIVPAKHTRFAQTYEDCFLATEAVDVLTGLGLAESRRQAAVKCNTLLRASLLVSVSHKGGDAEFFDGGRLYGFPDRPKLEGALARLEESMPAQGTTNSAFKLALQTALDTPARPRREGSLFRGISASHLRAISSARLNNNPNQARGYELAVAAANVEPVIHVRDRAYNFKKYDACFVGTEAVSALVDTNLAPTRQEAVARLSELLSVGLVQHVTKEHPFEDKYLFYRFTSMSDIKLALDAIASLPSAPMSGKELVHFTALVHRYKSQQAATVFS